MGSNRPGFHRRKAIAREDALARGVELGRHRRRPDAAERARLAATKLEAPFWKGWARGQALAAKLEQLRLPLDADRSQTLPG